MFRVDDVESSLGKDSIDRTWQASAAMGERALRWRVPNEKLSTLSKMMRHNGRCSARVVRDRIILSRCLGTIDDLKSSPRGACMAGLCETGGFLNTTNIQLTSRAVKESNMVDLPNISRYVPTFVDP